MSFSFAAQKKQMISSCATKKSECLKTHARGNFLQFARNWQNLVCILGNAKMFWAQVSQAILNKYLRMKEKQQGWVGRGKGCQASFSFPASAPDKKNRVLLAPRPQVLRSLQAPNPAAARKGSPDGQP